MDVFHRGLVGKILVLDARFAGLTDGMLDDKGNHDLPAADATDGWSKEAGFRVRLSHSAEEEREKGWCFEAEFVLVAM